jgi:predicted phosphoadenosine phosphosulfate sulfurtransferase
LRVYLGIGVCEGARQRIEFLLDQFPRVAVAFSGGKDSTVLLDLAARAARKRGRRIHAMFVDLEGQFQLTVEHVLKMLHLNADVVDATWICLPLNLRNAVSAIQPQWTAWDPSEKDRWIRKPPPRSKLPPCVELVTDPERWNWYHEGMEFEDLVPRWADWFAKGGDQGDPQPTTSLVGIRSDESLNRWRTLASEKKERFENKSWTTVLDRNPLVVSAYPIADWRTRDVWIYHARTPDMPCNPIYELMLKAGVPLGVQRICQPYGDDQRRSLWLFHAIEPDTWGRVVSRVAGANQGALYASQKGNVLGNGKVTLPAGHTWKSFVKLLLRTLPAHHGLHYRMKIDSFVTWWRENGYPNGIPDSAEPKLEQQKRVPSWRRIARVILRNDYWCKGLSYTPHKSKGSYAKWKERKLKQKNWAAEIDA